MYWKQIYTNKQVHTPVNNNKHSWTLVFGDPSADCLSWQYIVQGKQDAVALNGSEWLFVCPTKISFSRDFEMPIEEVSCSLCSVCVGFTVICVSFPVIERTCFSVCSGARVVNMFDHVCDLYFMVGHAVLAVCNINKSAGFCCVCPVYLFACVFVFPVLLIPSLTLCVFSSLFFLRARWSSFYPFQNSLFFLSFSLPVFLPLSVMQAHSHLHPHSHPVPPPQSSVVFFLCPLHGFVLLPQCQGPADEVTLHRRAAGLTEPRPSPTPSCAERTYRPAASPPPAHYIFSSAQATSPLRLCKPQGTHKNIICRKAGCILASEDKHTHKSTSTSAQKFFFPFIHTTYTHIQNCTDSWKLLSSLIPSAVFQPVPCCLFRPLSSFSILHSIQFFTK